MDLTRRRMGLLTVALLLAAGLGLVGHGFYIPVKAWLAQRLLERSWTAAQAGQKVRPWPWADTRAVARLLVPRLQRSQILLAGAHGRSLAFGPGHVDGTTLPGRVGHSIISAHRDTHFAFLRNLRVGDLIVTETPAGRHRAFRVVDLRVMDTRRDELVHEPDADRLTLVTCYPFEALRAGGPLRYLVTAEPVPTVFRKSNNGSLTRAAYQAEPAALK